MFPLVDHDHSAAAEHDEQNVNLGIRVLGQLVAGWPRQESRVQVTLAAREEARSELSRPVAG
jgi:hypothetical protein